MATPMTPWTKAMLEVLADGDWHGRDDLLAVGARAVPPGRAFRHGEYLRNQPARRTLGPGPRVRGSDDTSIATGGRELVRKSLCQLVRRGTVERRGDSLRITNGAKP